MPTKVQSNPSVKNMKQVSNMVFALMNSVPYSTSDLDGLEKASGTATGTAMSRIRGADMSSMTAWDIFHVILFAYFPWLKVGLTKA